MNTFFKPISRSLTVLLAASGCLVVQQLKACWGEPVSHNAYLFSAAPYNFYNWSMSPETEQAWADYLGVSANNFIGYNYSKQELMKRAQQKGDREMVAYMTLLNRYLAVATDCDAWDYPTRAQLVKRRVTLQQVARSAAAYRGARFKAQYALLQQRALFGLKRWSAAAAVWTQRGAALPSSPYREMMRNLYAGCLSRMGKRMQAEDIYAEQGDYQSLQFLVKNYRNLAGIQTVYKAHPNAPTLRFLVQDLVNNVQETIDVFEAPPFAVHTYAQDDQEKQQWVNEVGRKVIRRTEAARFIAFAHQVLQEGKTQSPALWLTAVGCLHHLLGQYDEAQRALERAVTMKGKRRDKDNARAILAVNTARVMPLGKNYEVEMARQLDLLDSLYKHGDEDGGYDDHYGEVRDRMVHQQLVPRLEAAGQWQLATALVGAAEKGFSKSDEAPVYTGEYYERLTKLTPQQLTEYAQSVMRKQHNALEQRVMPWVDEADYLNDLIGTRYLQQGLFAEAIPFLERVSLDFLGKQRIAPYAKSRHWDVDAWQVRQPMKWDDFDETTAVKLESNRKLDFCREMLRAESLYRNAREGMERSRRAYDLASLYYHASYEGQCWWLTQYGVSCLQDSALDGTKDFVAEALVLLQPITLLHHLRPTNGEEKQEALQLQWRAYYALAAVQRDAWLERETWFWLDSSEDKDRLRPQSRQYNALAQLALFAQLNAASTPDYVSKCDVLRRFIKVAR